MKFSKFSNPTSPPSDGGRFHASASDDESDHEVAEKADRQAGEEKNEQGFFHISGSFHLLRSIEPVFLKTQRCWRHL
ncbi:hypothetical protein KHC17_16275 [Agrobacterium salinitolerans]|uniref:Uncharacterized protein n=1 Tax=Agrobacterium salinitolerans TaxID=1183413 RepID=A0A4Z1RAR8_9HYPH|nr:hypothetical protein [Agrobacterium salinitolerans]MCZ7865860.1 hypothetical protein [Agrobacterium salinitolerans]QXC52008.1 hypothetical protein KHC17_16275 [Agrobacterium salinitolerans]UYZ08786.1 hypothetical protein CFBP5507_07250 [Agrobacterium salinitolerans]